MKKATIVYCLKDGEILLGMKKERFGKGKWNGFGGKVGEGESIEDAAVRELREESGLSADARDLTKAAVVAFYFGETPIFECHVYLLRSFTGEPVESDEMQPQWFPLEAIPFPQMWPSDLYWFPAVLAGHTIEGVCRFDVEGKIVERFEVTRGDFT